jgi:hypothetical protein
MIKTRSGLMAALVACALTVATAAADEPEAAGMVIRVAGVTEPDLPARTEIPAHTAIKLGSDAQLTFLHYGKCKLITVAGGTLQLSKRDFTTDGKVENEAPGPCPRIYQIKGDAGGWVSRDLPPRLPVDAEIIFTGRRADKVVEASIYAEDRADKPLFRLELANRRATEPPDAELTPDKTYVLKVKLTDQPSPLEHGFVAIASGSRSSLVVLRID